MNIDNSIKKMLGNVKKDNFVSLKNNKQYRLPDGKQVIIKNNRNVPNKKVIWNVYKKIPDNKNIPIVFQTKKQYLKEYIKNQELKHNIDFPKKQEDKYIKNELKDMKNISARYTTKNNKYIEPRTVFFTGSKWPPKTFKNTAQHEVGHEIYERNFNIRNDWNSVNKCNSPTYYGSTKKEEDFADSYMLYKNNKLKKGKRLRIIKDNISKEYNNEYYDVTSPEYKQRVIAQSSQYPTYGKVHTITGKKLGAGITMVGVAVPVVLPLPVMGAIGAGVAKGIDKVKIIRTDEHDRPYKIPRIEVHRRIGRDNISQDKTNYENELEKLKIANDEFGRREEGRYQYG